MIIDTTQSKTETKIEICRRRGWRLASSNTVGAWPPLYLHGFLPGDSQKAEFKDAKRHVGGEPSIQCKCGNMHTFSLPLVGEEDEYIYCSCGRYICYFLQDGSMVTN